MEQGTGAYTAQVAVCGKLVADIRVRPFRPVRAGDPGSLHVVDQIRLMAGGLVTNTGLALARLGVSTLGVGRLGDDAIGELVRAELLEGNLQVEGIVRQSGAPTNTVIVCVDDRGHRTFHVAHGADTQFGPEDIEAVLPILRGVRAFVIGYFGDQPALDPHLPDLLPRLKRETGALIVLETAGPQEGLRPLLDACLPFVDIFIPSWEQAAELTGRRSPGAALDDLARTPGPSALGIKLGARGCMVRGAGGTYRVPAYPTTVVDSTGAGDIFLAGFLAAHLRGLDTRTACQVGSMAASISIAAVDGATLVPPLDTLLQHVANVG